METKGFVTPEAACEGVDFTLDKINYQSSVLTIGLGGFGLNFLVIFVKTWTRWAGFCGEIDTLTN